jgi:carboxynorspermidine decarboxylase
LTQWLSRVQTPAYVADIKALKRNLAVAAQIKQETGCKILLATKSFAMFELFPLFAATLDGTTASGLYEARLAHEHFHGEIHAYSPAYTEQEIINLLPFCHHLYFNSLSQLKRYGPLCRAAHGHKGRLGLRVNPQLSLVKNNPSLYDPSAPGSRFGVFKESLTPEVLAMIDALHVHNLCENMASDSVNLIEHLMTTIPEALEAIDTLNLGGGHYFTHPNYDIFALIEAINMVQSRFNISVILEPGGALTFNGGYMAASIIDIVEDRALPIAILDASPTCHMPDILEMPYRPEVVGDKPNGGHRYVLAGKTCLSGDVVGTYAFDVPLQVGDKVLIKDMLQYTLVKTTTFNGMPLPDLGILEEDGTYRVVHSFGYEDFKHRLSKAPKPLLISSVQ